MAAPCSPSLPSSSQVQVLALDNLQHASTLTKHTSSDQNSASHPVCTSCRSPIVVSMLILYTACPGWALYAEKHYMWALMLYLAEVARSAFLSLEQLASKAEAST